MKVAKFVSLIAISASISCFSMASHASHLPKTLEKSLVKICEAAEQNRPAALKRAIKRSGLKMRTVTDGLVCNGEDLFTFAINQNALKNAAFIAKRGNFKNAENILLAAKKAHKKSLVANNAD